MIHLFCISLSDLSNEKSTAISLIERTPRCFIIAVFVLYPSRGNSLYYHSRVSLDLYNNKLGFIFESDLLTWLFYIHQLENTSYRSSAVLVQLLVAVYGRLSLYTRHIHKTVHIRVGWTYTYYRASYSIFTLFYMSLSVLVKEWGVLHEIGPKSKMIRGASQVSR